MANCTRSMKSNSHSGANSRSKNESVSVKCWKTTSREADDLYSVLRCISALKREVKIESAIGPGGRIAVPWFKSYASIYVLKRSI